MRVIIWVCGLALFAVTGSYLVGLAARERSDADRTILVSDSFSRGLEACDVPGLRERVVGRGNHTTAYAGEFKPVASVPWVTGKSKIFFYVIAGRGTVTIGNAVMPAAPGDFFQMPAGIRHAVRVKDGSLRALYVEDEL